MCRPLPVLVAALLFSSVACAQDFCSALNTMVSAAKTEFISVRGQSYLGSNFKSKVILPGADRCVIFVEHARDGCEFAPGTVADLSKQVRGCLPAGEWEEHNDSGAISFETKEADFLSRTRVSITKSQRASKTMVTVWSPK